MRTTAVLAGATALGIGAGSAAFALWNDDGSVASSVKTGSLSLNIADAPGGSGQATWDTVSGSSLKYTLPDGSAGRQANPLASLTSTNAVAVPFKVTSSAWGRWGVDYSLGGFTVAGTDQSLAQAATAKLYVGVDPAACKAGLAATPTYSGSLSGFTGLANQQGVRGVKFENRTDTDNYCLILSLPPVTGTHTNTFTVEGGSVSGTKLDGSASWKAGEAEVPANAESRKATISLTLTAKRTGGA